MRVVIDDGSGFCFGVKRAIATLEDELSNRQEIYCVGDIVHNEREIERLQAKGLKIIDTIQLSSIKDVAVLFRAHGEPPSSYKYIEQNNLKLTDATCPVVLKLQERMREAWQRQSKNNGQIVLFGKKGHAEVIGLMGQTDNQCILIENQEQIKNIDSTKETEVFSQTTKDPQQYAQLVELIKHHVKNKVIAHNTICRQMADRAEQLKKFACEHDMILFVGGAKSSNSKVLFEICCQINENSYFVTAENEVLFEWFKSEYKSVGIFGATSTPLWLMERVKEEVEEIIRKNNK